MFVEAICTSGDRKTQDELHFLLITLQALLRSQKNAKNHDGSLSTQRICGTMHGQHFCVRFLVRPDNPYNLTRERKGEPGPTESVLKTCLFSSREKLYLFSHAIEVMALHSL